jgi:prepilin-type N-terminal cleavage/methylation domain-containing protein
MEMKNSMKILLKKSEPGFTLIEIVVAVGLFGVIMGIALPAFLNVNDMLVKTESFRAASDNVGLIMELMAREIRTGTEYVVVSCPDGDGISFKDFGGANAQYIRGSDGAIKRKSGNGCGGFSDMTSPDVFIDSLNFDIRGTGVVAGAGGGLQPRVIIVMTGHSGTKEKTKTYFRVQTFVSQRQLEG